ncbi:MAG: hypothetical protein LUD17_06275 [Bacteroidales bacterium]|nr:hypothetical protein [Bacteroidales bacterium]
MAAQPLAINDVDVVSSLASTDALITRTAAGKFQNILPENVTVGGAALADGASQLMLTEVSTPSTIGDLKTYLKSMVGALNPWKGVTLTMSPTWFLGFYDDATSLTGTYRHNIMMIQNSNQSSYGMWIVTCASAADRVYLIRLASGVWDLTKIPQIQPTTSGVDTYSVQTYRFTIAAGATKAIIANADLYPLYLSSGFENVNNVTLATICGYNTEAKRYVCAYQSVGTLKVGMSDTVNRCLILNNAETIESRIHKVSIMTSAQLTIEDYDATTHGTYTLFE